MSSLIEQAARRLAQLREAGAPIPDLQSAGEGGDTGGTRMEGAPAEPAAPVRSVVEMAAALAAEAPRPAPSPAPAASRWVDLDLEALAAAGFVSPHAPRSLIADQYRDIKRPLLANVQGKGAAAPVANGNLIMVTSALPREGKTFTALNLALSIATEMNNTVLLVDADVARPSLLELLGLPPQPGLLDLLVDPAVAPGETMLRTNVEKLSILPSGTPHPRATELLASQEMAALLEDMAGRYKDRIVIFDSPPLLMTTESRVLATHMGQIVLVVEAERTLQQEVVAALAAIEACPVKMLMLNKAKQPRKSGYSYGYGYAYGYG